MRRGIIKETRRTLCFSCVLCVVRKGPTAAMACAVGALLGGLAVISLAVSGIFVFSLVLFSNIYLSVFKNQMIVDVIHPGRANVAKSELSDLLANMYKGDSKLTVLFGFRTKFGGGKSTGFCLIYDNEDSMIKFEPKHRMVRKGLTTKKEQMSL